VYSLGVTSGDIFVIKFFLFLIMLMFSCTKYDKRGVAFPVYCDFFCVYNFIFRVRAEFVKSVLSKY